MRDRMRVYAVVPDAEARRARGRRGLSRFRMRLNAALSALGSQRLGLQLARANWRMTVPEFLLLRFGITLAAILVGWMVAAHVLPGVGLALLAYLAPGLLLRRAVNRRQSEFARQLTDVLILISGAMRAGHSLLQALELVVRELKAPASEEFERVVREVGLGVRLPQALNNLAARMQNNDLDMVVTSIDIQYQVGGNMAVMLMAVSETIRDRMRLFGEIRVITTQQRYTSYLLSILPIIVAALLFIINPSYMSQLFDPRIIWAPISSLVGIVLGGLAVRRIATIDV
jgi:tight adherence protein B